MNEERKIGPGGNARTHGLLHARANGFAKKERELGQGHERLESKAARKLAFGVGPEVGNWIQDQVLYE